MSGTLTVADATAAVVTDLGRSTGPQFGLPANGALDQYAARVANILVGNSERDALIETTLFDLAFVVDIDTLIAVTGAAVTVLVDGTTSPPWQPVPVRAGQRVRVMGMTAGVRAYVAVRGGLQVPHLLGGCAPDTVIGFGTRLLRGTTVPLGPATPVRPNPYLDVHLFRFAVPRPMIGGTPEVDVVPGPDADEFIGTADRLYAAPFVVAANSNHIGLRLTGELPVRTRTTEMISRGVPIGAVEVPPGDELLVLHRGRGVTAGYPVLGVVTSTSLDALGQVRPGQAVRFREVDADRANHAARRTRAALDTLRDRVETVLSCLTADDPAAIRPERSLT
jgi:biotin-dependent carboxylase-like uncharacterized protein